MYTYECTRDRDRAGQTRPEQGKPEQRQEQTQSETSILPGLCATAASTAASTEGTTNGTCTSIAATVHILRGYEGGDDRGSHEGNPSRCRRRRGRKGRGNGRGTGRGRAWRGCDGFHAGGQRSLGGLLLLGAPGAAGSHVILDGHALLHATRDAIQIAAAICDEGKRDEGKEKRDRKQKTERM